MTDLSRHPARVSRATAMEILCIHTQTVFAKVVDSNPQIIHRLKGETRNRYLRDELAKLLTSKATVCEPRGRNSKYE